MNPKNATPNRRRYRSRMSWESAACDSNWVASAIVLAITLTVAAMSFGLHVDTLSVIALVVAVIPGLILARDLRIWQAATEYRSAKLALLTQAKAFGANETIRALTINFVYYIVTSPTDDRASIIRLNRSEVAPLKPGFTGELVARIFFFSQKRSSVVHAVDSTVVVSEVEDDRRLWGDVPNIVFDYKVDLREADDIESTDAAAANIPELLEMAYVLSQVRATAH